MEMPPADPEQPMPGFVGGNTLLRELTDDAIDGSSSFREANQASVLFLRSLGGAYGDVPQDATAFPARDATWFAMAGAFDIPGLVDDAEPRRDPGASGTRSTALGDGRLRQLHPSTDRGRRRADVPARDDGAASPRSSASGTRRTSSAATTTCCPPDEPAAERAEGRSLSLSKGQWVSSASISVRSPDQRVWKVPGLSMRL